MPFESPTGTGTLTLVSSAAPIFELRKSTWWPRYSPFLQQNRTVKVWKKKSRSLQSEMIFAHVRDWFDSNMFKLSFSSEGSRRRAGWGIYLRNPTQLWEPTKLEIQHIPTNIASPVPQSILHLPTLCVLASPCVHPIIWMTLWLRLG